MSETVTTSSRRRALALLGVVAASVLLASPALRGDGPRRPAGLALDPADRFLVTANEEAGSVSLVDIERGEVLDELVLDPGGRPRAVALAGRGDEPGSRLTVAVSEAFRHRVAFVEIEEPGNAAESGDTRPGVPPRLRPAGRVGTGHLPAGLVFSPDGRRLWVACEGDGRVWEVDTGSRRVARRLAAVEGARRIVHATGPGRAGRLVVSGRTDVCELDAGTGEVVWTRSPVGEGAFNLGGLAVASGRVFVAHQVKPSEVSIDPQMIVWGLVISNRVTSLPRERSVEPRAGAPRDRVVPLDLRHRAAGDPAAVGVLESDGRPETLLVLSSGTDRLLFVDLDSPWFHGAPLTATEALPALVPGRRPVALALTTRQRRAWVASWLDDRVVEVELDTRRVRRSVTLRTGGRAPVGESAEERGARVFYDADRSRGGWYSCHSCHPDGGTRGHRFDTPSDGLGLAKKAPSLRGTPDTGPWSWLGRFDQLADQIASSLHRTMAVDREPSPGTIRDVAAFLRSLRAPDPVRPGEDLGGDPGAGREVFRKAGCGTCHPPPRFTVAGRRDVGVVDDYDGSRRFNPPSLRGVRFDFRFLHDGRAGSLEAVFREHDTEGRHGRAGELGESEFRDLMAYLRSL